MKLGNQVNQISTKRSGDFPLGKERNSNMVSKTNSLFSRWFAYGLAVCLLGFFFAGCGGSNPNGPSSTSGSTAILSSFLPFTFFLILFPYS